MCFLSCFVSFFFNDTATTEIYTLSLHDALPIYGAGVCGAHDGERRGGRAADAHGDVRPRLGHWHVGGDRRARGPRRDRKSTRLNSSHGYISYAVFCLKKKKNIRTPTDTAYPARS